jgi:hypothetical protein
MPYNARFINPLIRRNRDGVRVFEWELILEDDGSGDNLTSVRAPVKYVGRPTAQELLQSVRQLARRLGSATVAQAGGIGTITIDKPGKGSVVFHYGEPDPPDAPVQVVT